MHNKAGRRGAGRKRKREDCRLFYKNSAVQTVDKGKKEHHPHRIIILVSKTSADDADAPHALPVADLLSTELGSAARNPPVGPLYSNKQGDHSTKNKAQ